MSAQGTLLPTFQSREELRTARAQAAPWAPAATFVVERLGLPVGPVSVEPEGEGVTLAVGAGLLVRLYEGKDRERGQAEASALDHLHGRLRVPTPQVLGAGELEGWTFLVERRLRGEPLSRVWAGLSSDARISLVYELGRLVGQLHQVSLEGLSLQGEGWVSFVAYQAGTCADRQRRKGLGAPWLDQVPGYLANVRGLAPERAPLSLLHGRLTRDHVLVSRFGGGFKLTGLLDFGDAAVGAREYELAWAGLHVAGGDARLLRLFLEGYFGQDPSAFPRALPRTLLLYALLHKHADLRRHLEAVPPPPDVTTLEGLERAWFGI